MTEPMSDPRPTDRDVADAIQAEGGKVERSQVVLNNPIKTLGVHGVKVQLHPEVAANITVEDSAVVHAIGGWGGCLGTEPCDANRPVFSKLNNGGLGFFDLTARHVSLSNVADIQAVTSVHAVPLPSSLLMLAPGLLALGAMRKRAA